MESTRSNRFELSAAPFIGPAAPSPRQRKTAGFTLVELLVVIGIIALLVSILLPSLNRAREMAKQTACLSNIRQLGMAFVMYVNDNHGIYPFSSRYDVPRPENWIWFGNPPLPTGTKTFFGQPFPFGVPPVTGDLSSSAIAKYLGIQAGQGNATAGGPDPQFYNIFRCPSDNVYQRSSVGPSGPYNYSYSMNQYFQGLDPDTGSPPYQCPPYSGVRNASEKIVLDEEDPLTINDGHWAPPIINPSNPNDPDTNSGGGDLLGIRHDMIKAKPDTATPPPYSATHFPNYDKRGNVAFADGHAEFVTREYAHDPNHLDPLR